MISVIIPTLNRADYLATVLKSLAEQSLCPEKFEVLVIDNGSSDHTVQTFQKAAKSCPNLKYHLEPEPGLHAGRHRGLKEAKGEILVYADDDIQASPSWLEAISDNFSDPNVAMVGGNNNPAFEDEPPAWLKQLWERPNYGGRAITQLSVLSLPEGKRDIDPFLIWGCNFSIRKRLVLEAGGFHPDGMPRELLRFRGDGETHVSHYVFEKGMKCIFDSRASVEHAVTAGRMTFEYFWQSAFNHGISDSYTQLRKLRNVSGPASVSGRIKQWILTYRNRTKSWDMGSDPELKKLAALVRKAYLAGYSFHRQKYHEDPQVRAWVHKQDYFDNAEFEMRSELKS